MARRTKKVGISGKFGPRYGVRIRRRINELEIRQKRNHTCPECQYDAVKRLSTGIWNCKHCGYKFTGGAYLPTTAVGESRMESIRPIKKIVQKKDAEKKKVKVKVKKDEVKTEEKNKEEK